MQRYIGAIFNFNLAPVFLSKSLRSISLHSRPDPGILICTGGKIRYLENSFGVVSKDNIASLELSHWPN
jgi:hypothetical protein